MWYSPGDFDVSPNPEISSVKRQSLCQLEGDATVDEILNQQFKMYTSLSQTRSHLKMVQSLVPIWEEEYERTGTNELEIPADPSKPPPEDVLRTLSLGPEFINQFVELHNEAGSPLCLTPLDKDVRSVQQMTSSKNDMELSDHLKERRVIGSLSSQEEDGAISSTDGDGNVRLSFNDKLPASRMIETLDKKVADKEALGLLKWLASTQAADDINSDDELLRETILSPLLPASSMEEVLEKANLDYESESQKECQDILDSVDDFVDFKGKERADLPEKNHCLSTSSGKIIPQVDGADDDMFLTPARSTEDCSKTDCKRNFDEACEHQVFLEDTLIEKKVVEDAHTSFNHRHKRKKLLWGSLPFSINEKSKDEREPVSFCTETKGPITASSLSEDTVRQHEHSLIKHAKSDICDGKEAASLVGCSVRDLMRRKRHYRVDPVECCSQGLEEAHLEMKEKEDTNIFPRNSEFQVLPIDEPNERPCVSLGFSPLLTASQSMLHEVYDVKATGYDTPMSGEFTLSSRIDGSLVGSTTDDGNFTSLERDNSDGSGVATRSGNFISTGPSDMHTRSSLSKPGVPDSAAAISHSENSQESGVLLLKSHPRDNTFAAERLESMNAAALSCFQIAVGHDKLCVKSCTDGQFSRELEHEMSPKKSVGMNRTIDVNALSSGQSQGDVLPLFTTDRQDTDLISLTFCRKPPPTAWINRPSRKAYSYSFISHLPCADKESHDGASGKALDDFLPFFMENCQDEAEVQNKFIGVNESTSEQEAPVGVPTHYQNDGSYSYLLTPLVSPPPSENVKRWLSAGNSVEENTVLTKPSSHKGKH